jgi:DNA-binding response OmpR family regulator
MQNAFALFDDKSKALFTPSDFQELLTGISSCEDFEQAKRACEDGILIAFVCFEGSTDRPSSILEKCLALRQSGRSIILMGILREQTAFSLPNRDDLARSLAICFDDVIVVPQSIRESRLRIERLIFKSQVSLTKTGTLISCGPLAICIEDMTATAYETPLRLTRRELDLLAFLMRRADTVVTKELIAEGVWRLKATPDSFDNVLNGHLSRIREKLGDAGCRGILKSVRGKGVCLMPDAVPRYRQNTGRPPFASIPVAKGLGFEVDRCLAMN